jgi:hypothetical protein
MLRASILGIDSGVIFSERVVTNKTLVLGLLLACLANLICLVGYL